MFYRTGVITDRSFTLREICLTIVTLTSRLLKVHLITACQCVHLVTMGHFRSRDKDGGHTILSAIGENPMLHPSFMALFFIEPELSPNKVLQWGHRDFLPFFAPVTLTLTR